MAVEPRAEEPAQGARGPGPRGVRQARQPGLVPRLVRKQQDGAHAGERHDSVPDGTRCRQRVEDVRQQDHVEPAPPADELESGEAVSLAPPVQGPRGHGKPGAVERQVPFGQRYHLGPVRQQHAPSQREGRDDARQAAAAPQLQEAPAAEQLARERARAPRPRARREPVCQHHAPVPQVAPRRHVARRQLLPRCTPGGPAARSCGSSMPRRPRRSPPASAACARAAPRGRAGTAPPRGPALGRPAPPRSGRPAGPLPTSGSPGTASGTWSRLSLPLAARARPRGRASSRRATQARARRAGSVPRTAVCHPPQSKKVDRSALSRPTRRARPRPGAPRAARRARRQACSSRR
ncbi:unnamed protein product [Prorocentrum cordatum]|uniref:Uncharacterized protein n=1 Tax=Prorocentrum cordatum TaxID=2364126 RepID=A0ABN9TAP6_9DINO|nr:unnamed protein product [Polarella glacialis]